MPQAPRGVGQGFSANHTEGNNLLKQMHQGEIPEPPSYFASQKTMHALCIYICIVLRLNKPRQLAR